MKTLIMSLIISFSINTFCCESIYGPIIVWPSNLSKLNISDIDISGDWQFQTEGKKTFFLSISNVPWNNQIKIATVKEKDTNTLQALIQLEFHENEWIGPVKYLKNTNPNTDRYQMISIFRSQYGWHLALMNKSVCKLAKLAHKVENNQQD